MEIDINNLVLNDIPIMLTWELTWDMFILQLFTLFCVNIRFAIGVWWSCSTARLDYDISWRAKVLAISHVTRHDCRLGAHKWAASDRTINITGADKHAAVRVGPDWQRFLYLPGLLHFRSFPLSPCFPVVSIREGASQAGREKKKLDSRPVSWETQWK